MRYESKQRFSQYVYALGNKIDDFMYSLLANILMIRHLNSYVVYENTILYIINENTCVYTAIWL